MSQNKLIAKFKGTEKPLVVEDIKTPGSKKGTVSGNKDIQKKDTKKGSGQDTIIKMGDQVVKDKETVPDKPKKKQNEINHSAD